MQTLQNKLNRILTNSHRRTSTVDLLDMTNSLSIQQMIAYQTLIMTFKILQTSMPKYLSSKIKFDVKTRPSRRGKLELTRSNYKLNQCKEGFVNRAISLYNNLDDQVKTSENLNMFKTEVREWIKKNIRAKPN